MENYIIDKEKSLDNIDLGTDLEEEDLSKAKTARILRTRRETEICDDEKELQHSRRISISWKFGGGSGTLGKTQSLELLADSDISLVELERQYEIQIERNTLLERASCSEDVIHVWTNISRFIISSLKGGKGVKIPGLLTITYQTQKQSLTKNDLPDYFAFKKIPLMIMSEFVIKRYGLLNKFDRCFGSKAPSNPIDLSEIAKMTKLPRAIVEGAIVEILQTFSRALACNKAIELPLPNIGKLQVLNHVATMKFYDQFYKTVGFTMEPPFCITQNSSCHQTNPYSYSDVEGGSITDYNTTVDPNFETIPGHMTPLRKHVPTEEFRSVFHLREVRSVHEEEIDVEDKDDLKTTLDLPEMNRLELLNWKVGPGKVPQYGYGKCADFYNDSKYKFLFPTQIQRERINISEVGQEIEEILGEGEEEEMVRVKKHKHRCHPHIHKHHHRRAKKIFPEEEEGELDYDGIDQLLRTTPIGPNKGMGEGFGEDRSRSRRGLLIEDTDTDTLLYRKKSKKSISALGQLKPNFMNAYPCVYTSETSLRRQELEAQRIFGQNKARKPIKSKLHKTPKPLYEVNPTGNFALDLILTNPDHYKTALTNHHYSMCSKILGIDRIRGHYERRGTGKAVNIQMNDGHDSQDNQDLGGIPPSPATGALVQPHADMTST